MSVHHLNTIMQTALTNASNWLVRNHLVVNPSISKFIILGHQSKISYVRLGLLPAQLLSTLYISIIQPHIDYCDSVWCTCNQSNILTLQKMQNRAASIITIIFCKHPVPDKATG